MERAITQNKATVAGFFATLNRRDLMGLGQWMAADVIDHNTIIYGEDDVPGAAFDGFSQQLAAFDPLILQVEELLADDQRVVARIA